MFSLLPATRWKIDLLPRAPQASGLRLWPVSTPSGIPGSWLADGLHGFSVSMIPSATTWSLIHTYACMCVWVGKSRFTVTLWQSFELIQLLSQPALLFHEKNCKPIFAHFCVCANHFYCLLAGCLTGWGLLTSSLGSHEFQCVQKKGQ